MKKMILIAISLIGASAHASETLSCSTATGIRGEYVALDLSAKTASLYIYCHALGCSGEGIIKSHVHNLTNETFVLEMTMDSSTVEPMILKVYGNGSGELFNHPRISKVSHCVRKVL